MVLRSSFLFEKMALCVCLAYVIGGLGASFTVNLTPSRSIHFSVLQQRTISRRHHIQHITYSNTTIALRIMRKATMLSSEFMLGQILFLLIGFTFRSPCDAFTVSSASRNISFRQTLIFQSQSSDDDEPTPNLDPSQLEWLQKRSEMNAATNTNQQAQAEDMEREEAEIEAAEALAGNVNIPKTGISINDEMTELQNTEKYVTQLYKLETSGVAALQTVTTGTASDEPMRYIVPLDDYQSDSSYSESEIDSNTDGQDARSSKAFAMVDLPPFSEDLVLQMNNFMGEGGVLSHILITCRNGIHYDEAPAIYVTRKSDMVEWKNAFPSAHIVMYRLDLPRDCKASVTQTLDGYGPWALDDDGKFSETGRPLTVMEWTEDIQAKVLDDGETPPDDADEELEDDAMYTADAIKGREEGKDILAIYTPGHTYGSVSYIFPKSKVCCSGFTFPVEDTRTDASVSGMPLGAGPKLDYSGYLTTNSGGIDRQVESARHLASTYTDRFEVVLPARGPPVGLGDYTPNERERILYDMLSEFAELGRVYSSMGIL